MAPNKKKNKKSHPNSEDSTSDLQQQLNRNARSLLGDSNKICPACPTMAAMDMDDIINSDDEDDDSNGRSNNLSNNANNVTNNNSDCEDDVCLHCQTHSAQVQVRCDECSAYICSHCHWCHEFQANHEIRVCDRCDGFYCRACDEMDQCDDCGEVVCGSCSTLLSCKFCGGGLCEECATACGRCGIVLCSRDAKFAVECDTCRLSYCLVCLASGNKDPCVRCGHRPSKRMEQLVHLRLKSIYKAFKSSTAATAATAAGSNGGTANSSASSYNPNNISATASSTYHSSTTATTNNNNSSNGNSRKSTNGSSQHHQQQSRTPYTSTYPGGITTSSNLRMRENDDPLLAATAAATTGTSVDDLTPGALMLAAAASAAAPSSQLAAAAAAAAAAASVAPNSQLAAAAQAAAGLAAVGAAAPPPPFGVPNNNNGYCHPTSVSGGGSSNGSPMPATGMGPSVAAAEAAARLNARASAESYEAERVKAEKAAAALLAELDEEEQAVKSKKSKKKKKKERQQAKRAQQEQDDQKNTKKEPKNGSERESPPASTKKVVPPSPSPSPPPRPAPSPPPPPPPPKKTAAVKVEKDPPSISDEKHHAENTTANTATTATTSNSTTAEVATKPEEKGPPPPPDPLELEFEELLGREDIQALEDLLSSIKGVPGKAVLRKNVKKAVKRLRAAQEEAGLLATANSAAEAEEEEQPPPPAPEQIPPAPPQPPEATPVVVHRQSIMPPRTPTAAPAPLVVTQQQQHSQQEPPAIQQQHHVQQQPPHVATTPNNNHSHQLPNVIGSGGHPVFPLPGTVTPIAQSPRVAELLTIVSQNHNKVSSNSRLPKGHPGTPKSECIMHMAPLIVGWVIGKGGQRIRDLMEESGARIWIDQDSMGPTEPRIVYVSGQRNNVDTAVRMITDLIAKAPTETPTSKQTPTPGGVAAAAAAIVDSHHSNNTAPSLHNSNSNNLSKLPGLPAHMGSGESSAFLLRPREKKKNGEAAKAWREMTCDPRFVPLLIGRRGWTIKNIQDSSGARVDIDQNVTPRKITISGSDAAVEIAARMVGDVLSYPHSLLHNAADDVDVFPGGAQGLLDDHEDLHHESAMAALRGAVGGGVGIDRASLVRPSSPVELPDKNRSHHSPPSSLIMTGDGKSTISATSSLSSTPEPSVSTKANNNLAQVPPLLPPAFDQTQQPNPHAHEMMHTAFGGFPPAPTLHGGLPPQDPSGLGLGQAATAQAGHPQQAGFLHGHGMGPTPMTSAAAAPPPPPPLSVPQRSFEQPHQPALPFSSGPMLDQNHSVPPPHHHQSQNGFSNGLPPLATPESHTRPLVNPPMPHAQQQQQAPASVPQGLWDAAPPPPQAAATNNRNGYGLEAAVDFLHHSQGPRPVHTRSASVAPTGMHQQQQQPPPPPRQSRMSELIGLPSPTAPDPSGLGALGLDRRTSAPPFLGTSASADETKDESNIVDSLFGSSSDPRNDVALLSGLRGLSLDPSPATSATTSGADLWGAGNGTFDLPPIATTAHQASTTTTTTTTTSSSSCLGPPQAEQIGGTSLFSTIPMNVNDRQHSRFSWGESD